MLCSSKIAIQTSRTPRKRILCACDPGALNANELRLWRAEVCRHRPVSTSPDSMLAVCFMRWQEIATDEYRRRWPRIRHYVLTHPDDKDGIKARIRAMRESIKELVDIECQRQVDALDKAIQRCTR